MSVLKETDESSVPVVKRRGAYECFKGMVVPPAFLAALIVSMYTYKELKYWPLSVFLVTGVCVWLSWKPFDRIVSKWLLDRKSNFILDIWEICWTMSYTTITVYAIVIRVFYIDIN